MLLLPRTHVLLFPGYVWSSGLSAACTLAQLSTLSVSTRDRTSLPNKGFSSLEHWFVVSSNSLVKMFILVKEIFGRTLCFRFYICFQWYCCKFHLYIPMQRQIGLRFASHVESCNFLLPSMMLLQKLLSRIVFHLLHSEASCKKTVTMNCPSQAALCQSSSSGTWEYNFRFQARVSVTCFCRFLQLHSGAATDASRFIQTTKIFSLRQISH